MPWPFNTRKKSLSLPATEHSTRDDNVTLPVMAGRRRFLNTVPYMLPKDLEEINRLDFQHYALRATLKGNHVVPLAHPQHILDVGCGTGQWCYELCAEFPEAQVTGFDLEAGKAASMANYRFIAGNALDGLPFPDASFDYVHQRLLVTALPLTAWPLAIKDLARVTQSGGWVELLEGGNEITPVGPATEQLFNLMSQLAAIRGLDTTGTVSRSLAEYLRQAGLHHVEQGVIDIPMGEWGGRVGSMMATNFRTTFTGVRDILQTRFQLPREDFERLLATMQQEWEHYHTIYRFTYAYGQK